MAIDIDRPLFWVGSSKRDYMGFPAPLRHAMGYQLYLAQLGLHPSSAKPLKGLGGGTIELIEEFAGDAYRAVYTARFAEAVYVLHAFKKKSKRGIATPRADIELIRRRLRDATGDHEQRFRKEPRQ